MKLWKKGAGKSSLRHTFNSHCHCGDSVSCCRSRVWIARSLLGRDRDAGSDAVNSRRDAVAFDRTHCRYGAGCSGWRAPGKLFHREPFGVRSGGIFPGTLVLCISHGENAYRYASVTRAIIVLIPRSHAAWIVALHRFFEVSVGILVALALVARVAGASTRIRKTKRRIICALCCHARSAHMNSHSKFVSVYLNNARVVCPA